MSNSTFGPIASGVVSAPSNVRHISRREMDVRRTLRSSTDPIDVATHFDPASRKQAVQAAMAKPEERKSNFNKALDFLGVSNPDA